MPTTTRGKPFARALALAHTIGAIMSRFAGSPLALRQALGALPAYRSRGHGKHTRQKAKSSFKQNQRRGL